MENEKNDAVDYSVRVECDLKQSGGPLLRVLDEHGTILSTLAFCVDGLYVLDATGRRLISYGALGLRIESKIGEIESKDGKFTTEVGRPDLLSPNERRRQQFQQDYGYDPCHKNWGKQGCMSCSCLRERGHAGPCRCQRCGMEHLFQEEP